MTEELIVCTGDLPPSLSFPVETRVQRLRVVSGPTTDSFVLGPDGHYMTVTYTGPTTVWTTKQITEAPQLQPHVALPDCCGVCELYIGLVEVFYWPVPGADNMCHNHSMNATMPASLSSDTLQIHMQSLKGPSSYAIGSDGFTL